MSERIEMTEAEQLHQYREDLEWLGDRNQMVPEDNEIEAMRQYREDLEWLDDQGEHPTEARMQEVAEFVSNLREQQDLQG